MLLACTQEAHTVHRLLLNMWFKGMGNRFEASGHFGRRPATEISLIVEFENDVAGRFHDG